MNELENVYRLSAFSQDPAGGNPAGVWLGDSLPDETTMQKIAAQVGYSETAFIAPSSGHHRQIRYFSPVGGSALLRSCHHRQRCGAGRYIRRRHLLPRYHRR